MKKIMVIALTASLFFSAKISFAQIVASPDYKTGWTPTTVQNVNPPVNQSAAANTQQEIQSENSQASSGVSQANTQAAGAEKNLSASSPNPANAAQDANNAAGNQTSAVNPESAYGNLYNQYEGK